MKISASLEEARIANGRKDIIVREDFFLDELSKTLINKLVPPSREFFCVMNVNPYREHLQKNGQLFVLVERVGSDKPGLTKVRKIDGRVLELDPWYHLNFIPQEGACVQLVLGLDWRYIREKDLDDLDKGRFVYV